MLDEDNQLQIKLLVQSPGSENTDAICTKVRKTKRDMYQVLDLRPKAATENHNQPIMLSSTLSHIAIHSAPCLYVYYFH